MGRATKSERLTTARPILMSSTITFCKLNFQKLYARSRRLKLAEWNESLDYADFIHALWGTMLKHDALKEEAAQLEEILGNGDAIQILSDIVTEHRISSYGN